MNTHPSPIALFTYNRPLHTGMTIDALKENGLAPESELYVFSDGPALPEDKARTAEVRDLLRSVDGFKRVHVVERDRNMGLAGNIVDGVSRVVGEHGRAIVLEDDVVTSPYFLQYMNEALSLYEKEEGVWHISAYNYPVAADGIPETFFFRVAFCWGWGTWGRAWGRFEKDAKALYGRFSRADIKRFDVDGCYDFWSQVRDNRKGRIDTWAVFWYAAVFLNGGLCLTPARSLVSNIGHDSTGMHCGTTGCFSTQPAAGPVTYFERDVRESGVAVERIKAFYRGIRPSFAERAGGFFKRFVKRR